MDMKVSAAAYECVALMIIPTINGDNAPPMLATKYSEEPVRPTIPFGAISAKGHR